MLSDDSELLNRYKWFSEQSCRINEALAAVKNDVERAYSGNPSKLEYVFLFNDLQLFLMQVFAFDGFITACLHALGLSKEHSLTQRLRRLANADVKASKAYQALESSVGEIVKVRDAWVHGQGSPRILKDPEWPRHLRDRFGLYEKDDRLWIRLSCLTDGGSTVFALVVCALHQMAELIWPCVVTKASGAGN